MENNNGLSVNIDASALVDDGGDKPGKGKKPTTTVKPVASINGTPTHPAVAAVNRGTGLSVKADPSKIMSQPVSPNFTPTKDPNVVIGKYGAVITRDQYLSSLRDPANTMKFSSFEAYADWIGEWANKLNQAQPSVVKPPVKTDQYERYSTPGSGGMRYHE